MKNVSFIKIDPDVPLTTPGGPERLAAKLEEVLKDPTKRPTKPSSAANWSTDIVEQPK